MHANFVGRVSSRDPILVISWLSETVTHAKGWRRMAWAFGAGALSVLAMPPFLAWPTLFLTLPVLVWLIDGAGARARNADTRALMTALSVGWWFGFGYFLAGLYWIGEAFLVEADKFAWALPFAVTLMPAGLALFTAAAAVAARLVWPEGLARLLVLSVALATAEWLRGHVLTGFPWNVLGMALTAPLPLMQGVSLLGVYGLTLWTVLVATAPFALAADARQGSASWRGLGRGLILAAVPLALLAAYGALRLATPTRYLDGPRLRVVQPSIPQRDKWRPEKQAEIFRDHLALSRRNAAGVEDNLSGVTHVIWPEAAMPFLPLDAPDALAAIGDMLPEGTRLITGALRAEAVRSSNGAVLRRGFNSLMAFGDNGALIAVYDKIHLVPFGEYLPFQRTLESLGFQQLTRMRGGFSVGRTPRPVLDIPGLPSIVGLICYEAVFPGAIVARERPGLLINVTNDGWFGATTGPYQHFHQARLRAIEEGLPLVRAANNGLSAVIDSRGRILGELGLDARGVLDVRTPSAEPAPPYARFGDMIFLINALIFAIAASALILRQRSYS